MARAIRSTAIDYGRNPDTFVPDDRENVRCAKCGFICNKSRETRSEDGSRLGYGISLDPVGTAFSSTVGFSTTMLFNGSAAGYDPVVVGGCPFCGTFLYNK